MGLSTIRGVLRFDRSLWRNLLLTVATVAIIVIGVLAMHTLNLEHGESASLPSASAQTGHSLTMLGGADAPRTADQCGGAPCSPEHSMTVMACILALLVSALLLGMIRVIVGWRPMRSRIATPRPGPVALPLSLAPSLDLLCISRT